MNCETGRNMNRDDLIRIVQETGHHPMGPSAAFRWMQCPGSVSMSLDIHDPGSDAAREGTAAHTLGEICLSEGVDCAAVEGYDDEMRGHVQTYVDYVRHLSRGGHLAIEQELDLSRWIPEGMGTADALVLDGKTLHVVDFKYGLRRVEVERNIQLQIYALGALEKLGGKYPVEKVVMHIHQPRVDGASSWETDVPGLLIFGAQVAESAERCMDDKPDLKPSESACRWCRAAATCPALYQRSLELVGGDFEVLPDVETLTDQQIRFVLDNKGLLTDWLKRVEDHVFATLNEGGSFEGYKMVEGRSVRKWNDSAADVLQEKLGDAAWEKKLIGIGVAERLLGKKEIAELGITDKPEGKPTLAPESDKRPALGSVADDFETLN